MRVTRYYSIEFDVYNGRDYPEYNFGHEDQAWEKYNSMELSETGIVYKRLVKVIDCGDHYEYEFLARDAV